MSPLFLEIRYARTRLGFVHVHLDPVPFLDLCHERVRLGEVIEGVDEDEGWLGGGGGCDFGEHVDGDEARETECGGLVEMGEVSDGPFEDLGWFEGAEVVVDRGEGLWRERELEGSVEWHCGRRLWEGGAPWLIYTIYCHYRGSFPRALSLYHTQPSTLRDRSQHDDHGILQTPSRTTTTHPTHPASPGQLCPIHPRRPHSRTRRRRRHHRPRPREPTQQTPRWTTRLQVHAGDLPDGM